MQGAHCNRRRVYWSRITKSRSEYMYAASAPLSGAEKDRQRAARVALRLRTGQRRSRSRSRQTHFASFSSQRQTQLACQSLHFVSFTSPATWRIELRLDATRAHRTFRSAVDHERGKSNLSIARAADPLPILPYRCWHLSSTSR